MDTVFIRDLALLTRIGIDADEQGIRQPIRVSVELLAERGGSGVGVVCYRDVADRIERLAGERHTPLVEELADHIAASCLLDPRVHQVTVRIEKTRAIAAAAGAGVEIVRGRAL